MSAPAWSELKRSSFALRGWPFRAAEQDAGRNGGLEQTCSMLSSTSSTSTLSALSGGGGSRQGRPLVPPWALLAGQLTIARSDFASEQTASSKPGGTCGHAYSTMSPYLSDQRA